MLAAVAWPMQEIFHPILVDAARSSGFGGTKDILVATAGKSPSLLNGGLNQWEIAPTLALAVFMASVLEKKSVDERAAQGLKFNEYSKTELPGDLSFDPLRITRSRRWSSRCPWCATRPTSSGRSSSTTASAPSWTRRSRRRRWTPLLMASPTRRHRPGPHPCFAGRAQWRRPPQTDLTCVPFAASHMLLLVRSVYCAIVLLFSAVSKK